MADLHGLYMGLILSTGPCPGMFLQAVLNFVYSQEPSAKAPKILGLEDICSILLG